VLAHINGSNFLGENVSVGVAAENSYS